MFSPKRNLASDLVLPTLLFATLGAMTWAVRGCSGYGGSAGCLFAGVTWGAAWWFIAREPGARQSRPYSSGWIILALAVGIGLSGNRGWMQWPSFFEGHLQTNTAKGEFVPITKGYGFLWLFIAGVPWAGLGACALAWCNSLRPLRWRGWCLRASCGAGGAALALVLFNHFPEWFLPLYKSMAAQYADLQTNPNLRRLINDNRNAILHLGIYLGLLGFEIGRGDRRNVTLILTVALVNGLGWAAFQNWKWAPGFWPGTTFNWWRCWESSGGISIGIAYGLAYFLVNRPLPAEEQARHSAELANVRPNLERFGAYLGLLLGLVLSIKNGFKGWLNIYVGKEDYWNGILWRGIGPLLVLGFVSLLFLIRSRPLPRNHDGDVFPHAHRLIWLVLITQNVLAQIVTGPLREWREMSFSIYYLLLLCISGLIIHHFQRMKR